jgi:hypothetical protein
VACYTGEQLTRARHRVRIFRENNTFRLLLQEAGKRLHPVPQYVPPFTGRRAGTLSGTHAFRHAKVVAHRRAHRVRPARTAGQLEMNAIEGQAPPRTVRIRRNRRTLRFPDGPVVLLFAAQASVRVRTPPDRTACYSAEMPRLVPCSGMPENKRSGSQQ